jgi:low affinity Fe/Cu permease
MTEHSTAPSGVFTIFARWVERQTGRSVTFALAVGIIVAWVISGPLFGWSDTWQLVINTGTTIVTFLMVFVIQHTQHRDTQAIQLKLDELIRTNRKARNELISLEDMSEEDLENIRVAMVRIGERKARETDEGTSDR